MPQRKNALPPALAHWFAQRRWKVFPHQLEMLRPELQQQDVLLLAPTGSGKTLAGFLPSLAELAENPGNKLHTLYISPLKALANDIHRNLTAPVEEAALPISVATRTGDTAQKDRARQKRTPPNILLTTPESLALMLSYEDAAKYFAHLKTIIIDEIHAIVASKRGDHMALLMARLAQVAPQARRIGLSATVAQEGPVAAWLGQRGKPATILRAADKSPPDVKILYAKKPLPLSGHYGAITFHDLYAVLQHARSSIVFVNTRAQAEMLFQGLWKINDDQLSIAIHHGSLTRDQRVRVERAMAEGKVRVIVATASLDLGIDWGDVDLVVQMGAPKGLSRLRQRIGRSNHRIDGTSRALLMPTNRFEALECEAALDALRAGQLDDHPPHARGALDVLCQHIFSCACAGGFEPDALFAEITNAYPYFALDRATFNEAVDYVRDGGYVLKRYERFARLIEEQGRFLPASRRASAQHRMNIGTIVEYEKLKVLRISGKPGGKRTRAYGTVLGEIEERLVTGMEPGDTFAFAGQILQFHQIHEMSVEVTPAASGTPKIPAYSGGKMPLSSHLAQIVRALVHDADRHQSMPAYIREWLEAQASLSSLPPRDGLLVESFLFEGAHYLVAYPFEGRAVHQSLGFLITHRMQQAGLLPLGFTVSDYGIAVWSHRPLPGNFVDDLFSEQLLATPLDHWLAQSAMLKRVFRTNAIIAGMIQRKLPGRKHTGKQVTFSTDLIYDVLQKYEPEHLLLRNTRFDTAKELADLPRLESFLARVQHRVQHNTLERVSPFAIPVVLEIVTEGVGSKGLTAALAERNREEQAQQLWAEIQHG